MGEIKYKLKAIYDESISVTYTNTAGFCLMISLMVCVKGVHREYEDVIKRGKYHGSYVIKNNHRYSSDSTTTIIGETKQYIFFYNKLNHTTFVLNRDEISEYHIRINTLNTSF